VGQVLVRRARYLHESVHQASEVPVLSLLHKILSRSGRRAAGHAGVAFGQDSFALVLLRREGGGRPTIEHCAVHPVLGTTHAALAETLEKLGAGRAETCGVIDGDDYQVIQVEAPDVLPAEMRAAVRWRLRDAITFKVDTAVIDVFEMPESARRTQTRMLFAVAAQAAAVERLTSALQPASSGFYAIDIPELCLRNVCALLPQHDKGVAMLALNESYAQLITARQGVLYLTRRIDNLRSFETAAAGNADDEFDLGALTLELQRSLDYYESHYDQTPIGDLVIAPGGERAQRLAAAIRNETSLRVSVLDVRELCDVRASGELVNDWPTLMALGAALRCEAAE
jgi:MSHA biogenesis protein MshI